MATGKKLVNASVLVPTEINPSGVTIRVLGDPDSPQFVAVDVCSILELSNPNSSLALIDADEKGVHTVDTLGGKQQLVTVSESGFYQLVFKSRKPSAKAFQKWVCGEVLPCIRKHGCYPAPAVSEIEDDEDDTILKNIDFIIHSCQQTKELRLRQKEAERKIREAQKIASEAKFIATAAYQRIEGDHGYVSLVGYCNLTGRKLDRRSAARHGLKLGKICRERGIDRGECASERDGSVKSYPKWLLAEYFGDENPEPFATKSLN